MNNHRRSEQAPVQESYQVTMRYAELWESVDDFKVNKWMLKLGAKWTVSEAKTKSAATGIGDQWELQGMKITQTEACKLYYAVHVKKWWWRFFNV